MAAFTFVELLPMEGVERDLEAGATIGREGCDIVLHDPQVSRHHATLRMTEAGPAVEDFASTNGTFVNGERVEGVRTLREGDVLRFGKTEWELRAARPRAQAAEPGPRGDVAPPPAVTPSAVHRVLPAQTAATTPPFEPVRAMQARGSAATRAGYTAFCIAVVVATVVALVVYFLAN